MLHVIAEAVVAEFGIEVVADYVVQPPANQPDIATNCPHTPLEIADEWVDPYREMGINDTHAKIYGMVENIDLNVGKVLDKLEELED